MPRTSETTFNVEFKNVLTGKHPRWADRITAEQSSVLEDPAARPDIVVKDPGGLPVVLETEYTPARTVEADACSRLGQRLVETADVIEQTIAVRVPVALRDAPQGGLAAAIEASRLEYCVYTGTQADPERWPSSGWLEGGVDEIADVIEHVSLSESRLAMGMDILERGIAETAGRLLADTKAAPDVLPKIAAQMHQEPGEQTARMAMAIVANAMVFHSAIAGAHGIEALAEHRGGAGMLSKPRILKTWRHILENINYWPIFRIASDILAPIRNGTAQQILDRLEEVASDLANVGATSHRDLCGRMFQRLITDRKFLATFYTLPSSSALLAELAIDKMEIDWSDRDAVTALRIADFACGTGALLNAAYESAQRRYRRQGRDDEDIHPDMMSNALIGIDIMPAATHLTATVLSSSHPGIPFNTTSIITASYGQTPTGIRIGSLELLSPAQTVTNLFGHGPVTLRGATRAATSREVLKHGTFDIVIMNPPFTRPTNHESTTVPVPSFAGFSTTEDEQKHMSARLRSLKADESLGHGNAGLASEFVGLADFMVKKLSEKGGVIALVLPASSLQGESWSRVRERLSNIYTEIVVVTIATAGTTAQSFSADTGMAEVIIVARRRMSPGTPSDALYINLRHRPRTILEAAMLARAIGRIPSDRRSGIVRVGTADRAGCYIRSNALDTGCAGIQEPALAMAAINLVEGQLALPQLAASLSIPITRLQRLGVRGAMHRDISGSPPAPGAQPRGPFDIVELQGPPSYPVLWSHAAHRETSLIVDPDREGVVRPGQEAAAAHLWTATASRLHFSLDFRINSQSLAAGMTPDRTIGGRAWPNFICANSEWEVPLVLWANTTLGLLLFWWIGTRQQQGRANLTITRLPQLCVLDARQLSGEQIRRAGEVFADFQAREFLPANEAWRDETRIALDGAVLVDMLGLPDTILSPLGVLREQWCTEPSVHGGKSTAPDAI